VPSLTSQDKIVDLFVIGGGVNGCGIARDAAGRGLSVSLAEMNDLASATSFYLLIVVNVRRGLSDWVYLCMII